MAAAVANFEPSFDTIVGKDSAGPSRIGYPSFEAIHLATCCSSFKAAKPSAFAPGQMEMLSNFASPSG